MQFLEHLEEWKIQALDRANSVVSAKVSYLPWLNFILGWNYFPLFFCVVIDGNKVCVKKIFPNEVQSAVKYHFGSLRIDGRLGLLASVLQSFYLYSHHLTTFFVYFSITVQSLGQWMKNCYHSHKRDQALQLNINSLSSCSGVPLFCI